MLNFIGLGNKLECAREGAAIEVTKPEEVAQTISDLLYNQDIWDRLMKARGAFISRHAYWLDGRSYKRVADLAEGLISL